MNREWLDVIKVGMILAVLGGTAVFDLKKREIPVYSIVLLFGIGLFGMCIDTKASLGWVEKILAFVPGLLSFVVAAATREKVGYGDAWILLALGSCLSGEEMLLMVSISFAVLGVTALFLLIVWKKNRSYELPFLPFLFFGYLTGQMVGVC